MTSFDKLMTQPQPRPKPDYTGSRSHLSSRMIFLGISQSSLITITTNNNVS